MCYEIRGHPKMSTFSWVYKQYTFSDPPSPFPPSVQTNIFGFQNMGFTQNIYCVTTKINPYFKLVWYITSDRFLLSIMICKFQLILYTFKFNLKIFLVGTKIIYVQFHNIKFKMPESQLLIGLETSFKNWQKALNGNIYYILKA